MIHDKTAMGRKSFDGETPLVGSGKHNRCVVLPANVPILADFFERRNQNWIARTNSASDLIIQVGDSCFHLHKIPVVSKSEYLNRLVFQRIRNSRENDGESLIIQIVDLPGGTKTFELVVKFCYGWKIDITATNVAPLYCAAHFLEMSEDLEQGNLISKTEAFLSFLMISSWKDSFRIFKSCESISTWAKELQIVKRCAEAVAWKASTNPKAFSFDCEYAAHWNFEASKRGKSELEGTGTGTANTWWFEDVSFLRIDHFIEVIQSIKTRGVKSALVGSCIANWTTKWFSQVRLGLDKVTPKHMTHQLHRVTTECLIRMLPTEEKSVSCNFLLYLLKAGVMLKINSELLNVLERRIASVLEQCHVSDLLVKNVGDNDPVYDVGVIIRLLQSYFSCMLSNPAAKSHAVGRLVDGLLAQVARDEKLTVKSFKSLVDALPQNARYCDDNLYRAIDMYLKAHPSLIEEERTTVCRVLEYHRLSQEARQHVMKNDRLPLKLTAQFVLQEQVNMTRSMISNGSNYRRTNAQTIIRISKHLEKGQVNAQEIKMIRKDVEMIKSQLKELHNCKVKLQKQLKIFG
ncbi:hypothetical protein L6164_001979 [Bauhinia variegata]|uniref:Uncharacterized protein n=1 Tax=Bauhinia variegata TaxID=167791 RepID=A0ACB9QB19_BAUVA|nr:hypothetical protein L6164_001979 [Bauhinia variegata]